MKLCDGSFISTGFGGGSLRLPLKDFWECSYGRESTLGMDFWQMNHYIPHTPVAPVGRVLSTDELVNLYTPRGSRGSDYPREGEETGFGIYRKTEVPEFTHRERNLIELRNGDFLKIDSDKQTVHTRESLFGPKIETMPAIQRDEPDSLSKYGILNPDARKESNPYVREEQFILPKIELPEIKPVKIKIEPVKIPVPYLDSLYHDDAKLVKPGFDHNWLSGKKDDTRDVLENLPENIVMKNIMKSIEDAKEYGNQIGNQMAEDAFKLSKDYLKKYNLDI